MSQTTKLTNAPKGAIKYNTSKLKELMNEQNIKARSIMSIFGQTNPTTVNNWMSGSEMYVGALLAICNAFDFDPLRFITFAGHTFETSIADLYRLELCGLTVGDILRERGIETSQPAAGVSKPRTTEDLEAEAEAMSDMEQRVKDQHKMYMMRENNKRITQISTADVIEKMTEIQQKAFEHEQASLEELRKQKDVEIAARDQTIMNLRILLARMGYQGMVADTNDLGEENAAPTPALT